MSRSAARAGNRQSPGAPTPISGHGFGLSWQNRMKSSASVLRQDGEIGLHESRRHAVSRPVMLVAPDREPRLKSGLGRDRDNRFVS